MAVTVANIQSVAYTLKKLCVKLQDILCDFIAIYRETMNNEDISCIIFVVVGDKTSKLTLNTKHKQRTRTKLIFGT